MLDVIMFIPNTLPILLHKNLGRGTQLKLSIPTLRDTERDDVKVCRGFLRGAFGQRFWN